MVTHLLMGAEKESPDYSMEAIILGCTHYPYFHQEIKDHFLYLKQCNDRFDFIIPEDIALIDPAKSLATELYKNLAKSNLWGNDLYSNSHFYISVPNYLFLKNQIDETGEFPYAWKYGRDYNTPLHFVKHVPFSENWIDESIRGRIKENIPTTYKIISFK